MKNCFICDLPFEKGISICCSRQCHNKRINVRSRDDDKQVLDKKRRIREYENNPNLCKQCQRVLPYESRHNNFCSRSCGASFNNAKRDHTVYKNQKYPYSRVTFRNCTVCNNVFRSKPGVTKYCSISCQGNGPIKKYRRACKFKISKISHPELFDNELLKKYGWYRAANHPKGYNPKGATWDHLFRIEDGFKLGIDPEIISHPANAQMISWEENVARKVSQITYEELLERIKSLK